MKKITEYLKLISQMFTYRNENDQQKEDDILNELDICWYEMKDEELDKIKNMLILGSKEKYLSIKNAWKTFIKENYHKKYKIPTTRCIFEDGKYIVIEEGYRWKSDLTDLHHVIYALVRNKKLEKMFKRDKLEDGKNIRFFSKLHSIKNELSYINKSPKLPEGYIENVLKPFNGFITKEDLYAIHIKLEMLYTKTNKFTDLSLE